ncbi:uncharacterized protein LOC132760000 [Ruditapes philippinarum]|uniref:uncharacterized protein LOC132760000 n=1 Tax=Ruditapes philippinarum TaxID=129788 RepID=UPI00295AAD70|nr:uncharacterized protein LOC132760000 [Ruditapes philippinarum]
MEDFNRKEKSNIQGYTICKANHASSASRDEYKAFVRRIEKLLTVVKTTKEEIDNNSREVTTAYTDAVRDIKKYREDIDAYLDEMERNLLERCHNINQENEKAIKKLDVEFKTMQYELDTVNSSLKSHERLSADMVLTANETSSHLKGIIQELKSDNGDTKLQLCLFKRSKAIRDMVVSRKAIGKLEVTLTEPSFHLDKKNLYDMAYNGRGEIKVKSKTDKKDCYITSIIVISSGIIACADWANNSVKLVDVKTALVLSEIHLASPPWDLAQISKDQIAVTVTSENKIQFLNKTNGFTKGHSIDVVGRCRGIAYNNDNLVVSYDDPSKVEIMNLHGKVLRCLKADASGIPLFERPYYVMSSSDGESVYVSDNEKHSVTRLAYDGEILATYKDTELRCPRGLVVCRDGSLLVCSSHGHSVHLISSECNKLKIMLRRKEGGEFCQAICYFDASDTLYLSNFTLSDQIRVYKFT